MKLPVMRFGRAQIMLYERFQDRVAELRCQVHAFPLSTAHSQEIYGTLCDGAIPVLYMDAAFSRRAA